MLEILDVKCNNMVNPIGIDEKPSFSFRLRSNLEDSITKEVQIDVYDEVGNLIWTGVRFPEAPIHYIYDGPDLASGTRYDYKVTVTVGSNDAQVTVPLEETAQSDRHFFVTGQLENKGWVSSWVQADRLRKPLTDSTDIGLFFRGMLQSHPNPEEILDPPVYIRKKVTVPGKIAKAVAYASAKGIYRLFINNQEIGDILAPEYTVYDHYQIYQTYDVTHALEEGDNVLGSILADGWYTGKVGLLGVGNQYGTENAFFLQVEITYEDGAKDILDMEGGRWHYGPYQYADLFVGERILQDSRFTAWTNPNYETSHWHEVKVVDLGTHNFKGRRAEPIVVLRRYHPMEVLKTPDGDWVLDAGENIAGYTTFKIYGQKGQVVKLEHSEELDHNGNFFQNIVGQNKNQTDIYEFTEDGTVVYEPRFTFHGFRYVRVSGLDVVHKDDFEIVVIGSDLETSGVFECSNPRLNQLQANIFRSQQGNMIAVPTDCPQRERAGYTGDMQVYAPTALFNMDMRAFLNRWLENMRLAQHADGQIPNVVPDVDSNKYIDGNKNGQIASAGWADACIILPYRMYQSYGDPKVLMDNYEMMKRWMKYVEGQAHIIKEEVLVEGDLDRVHRHRYLWTEGHNLGDWLTPSIMAKEGNPMMTAVRTREYVSTAVYAYSTELLAKIAHILENHDDYAYYMDQNQNIRQAFGEEYVDLEGGLPVALQGLYILALQMKLIPDDLAMKSTEKLVDLIKDNGKRLDTGFISGPFILDVLWNHGHKELAYDLLYQEAAPSWLYQVKMGATTIWENWLNIQPDGTRMTFSYNHFAFGCVGDFMYRKILGLNALEPGYKKVRIEPDMTCGLTYASGSYKSICGEIKIKWEFIDQCMTIDVTLPPDCSGELVMDGHVEKLISGSNHVTSKSLVKQ